MSVLISVSLNHQCPKCGHVFILGSFLSSRWEVIANYMNQHSTSSVRRTAKDVINKAKNLQRLGENLYKQNKHVLDTKA